jgi:hypothetical protein
MSPIYPNQIIVKSVSRDTTGQYGTKLKIFDANNMPFSISEKHQDLWPIFEGNIGKAVNLTWSIPAQGQNWKAFISKAEVATNQAPITATVPTLPVQASKPTACTVESTYNTKAEWAAKDKRERDSIEGQCAFKGAVELISTGKLPVDGRIGLLTEAYAISRLEDSLGETMVDRVNLMLKEAAKPKKTEKAAEK